jgi:hypothetical protein
MKINFKNCLYCKQNFDNELCIPKLLPCSHLMCKSCIDSHLKELSKFRIDCTVCFESNIMASIDDLPTSDIIMDILLKNEYDSNEQYLTENQISKLFSKLNELDVFVRVQNLDIYNHYFSVQCDIDYRAESLMQAINVSGVGFRELLINKISEERDKILKMHQPENTDSNSNEKKFSDLIKKLNKQKLIVRNSKSLIENELFSEIIQDYNKLQSYFFNLKKSSWYFVDSPIIQDKSIVGHLLNSQLDSNYTKIKNLKLLFKDESQHRKICFSSKHDLESLRHKIIPLSRDRIIKVSFLTHNHSLYLQLFDSSGEMLKHSYSENLTYFPVSYGHGNHFCVCYRKNPINLIKLYDSNLNLVASTETDSSIESVFMNENYIAVVYNHRRNACCSIFDYNLREIQQLGQQFSADLDFYMPNLEITEYERVHLKYKYNPQVFGLTDKLIYFFNHQEMIIMNRLNGIIVHKRPVYGDKPYFILDSQSNIIQVNKLSKRICIFNIENEFSIENTYKNCFSAVFATRDQNLAFIDERKKYLVMV